MERSGKLYQQRLLEPMLSTSECEDKSGNYILRLKILLFDKEMCFFCDKAGCKRDQLHKVATDSARIRLKRDIEMSHREDLKIRLRNVSNPGDCHARNIFYHKICLNTHNQIHPQLTHCLQLVTREQTMSLYPPSEIFVFEGKITMGEIENVLQQNRFWQRPTGEIKDV